MGSKGPSNAYGSHATKPTKHIGYAWAKDFNKNTLETHFEEHGQIYSTKEEYAAHAVAFANTINRDYNVSFIDSKGSTFKYNKKTNEFAIIDKKGYVITYFNPRENYLYYLNMRKREKR